MPIIAYQSFNANTSSTHGVKSLSYQRFTKQTNTVSRKRKRDVLEYPQDPGDLATPIEGPANRVPVTALRDDTHTTTVFGNHISQLWQHFIRALGDAPNLMVIGEMDASHQDFKTIIGGKNVDLNASPQKKACQSFSAISRSQSGPPIKELSSGVGYSTYSVLGLNVVCVHVPNEFATDLAKVKQFYAGIANGLLSSNGAVIHLVLGDTNQRSVEFTASALNDAFGTKAYKTAASQAPLIDTYPLLTTGTNSTGDKMYDVAVYRSDVVELVKAVYISQSPTGITVTDHCALGVNVKLKSAKS